MRVVSQDGLIDVPYEMTAFHICNGYIYMNMVGDTGRGTVMAVYSSQEKALAAMKTMREQYREMKIEEVRVDMMRWYNPAFQFPKYDEVIP